jgi:hypothetical protein
MPIFKHTIILEGPGHGASESLYFTMPTNTSVYQAWQAVGQVKNKRAKLLGAEWQVKGERVCMVRDDAGLPVKRVSYAQREAIPGVQAQPANETNISLLLSFEDSTGFRNKSMMLAGCPRSLFPNADALDRNGGGAFWSNFQSWTTLLISLQMGWMASDVLNSQTIEGYTFNPANGLTTYDLKAPGIPFPVMNKPYRVNVEFPLSRSPLDGSQLVIPTDAVTVKTASPRPAAPYTVDGTMTYKGSVFINLATTNPQGQTGTIRAQAPMSRKRGRPLLVSRGRQPVVRRW